MTNTTQKKGPPMEDSRRLITKLEFSKTRHLGMKRTFYIGNYIECGGICFFLKSSKDGFLLLDCISDKKGNPLLSDRNKQEIIKILKEYWEE